MALSGLHKLCLLISLVCFAPVLCADSPCKEQGTCYCYLQNGTYINLADISSHGKPRFSQVLYEPEHSNSTVPPYAVPTLFSYDPCTPFTEINSDATTDPMGTPCVNTLACKITPGTGDGTAPEMHSIAMPNQAQFLKDDEGFLSILYKTSGVSNLTVRLVCDKDVEHDLKIDAVGQFNCTMTLTTKCACFDSCSKPNSDDPPEKHGLSTGSILLIVFFTLLGIYLIGGVSYNYCNGAAGAEMLPHSRFWNDLPQLIIDGFLFTCSCFGRRSQGSYADM